MNEGRVVDLLSRSWTSQPRLTVLDADFGLGLLFLNLWDTWRHNAQRPQRLHVIGLLPCLVECTDIREAVAARLTEIGGEQLMPHLEAMLLAWPLNLPGLHRLEFESGAITLTLGVGALDVVLSRLSAEVDCFVAKDASFFLPASFLAAPDARGYIPRVCKQDVEVDVIAIDRPHAETLRLSAPWLQSPVARCERRALVIGAGFAGMGVAQALALRGWRVTVIDATYGQHSSTHHQHVAAALTPMVARDDNIRARLSRAGSLRAHSRWGTLPESVFFACGAIQLQRDQGRIVDLASVLDALQFPTQWVRGVSADQASELAGMSLTRGGVYFPTAARVQPQGLLDALAQTAGIDMLNAAVARISHLSGSWQALDFSGKVLASAPHVVLAGGVHSKTVLEQSGLLAGNARLEAMHALGGEVSFIPAQSLSGGPRCIVAGDGYVLPVQDGHCVIGSTYAHAAKQVSVTPDGIAANVKRAAGLLNIPELSVRLKDEKISGWAGWRAVVPGRLPVIGPVLHAPGVWVACGFASRGLTWATLAGDLIAGALNGEPLVLENDIIQVISEN